MPRTNFRSPYPCRPHTEFGFGHDCLFLASFSILFYSFHRPNTKNINKLVNKAALIEHGASDTFDLCEAKLYSMTCLYNQHY